MSPNLVSFCFSLPPLLLLESLGHQVPFLRLNVENTFFNRILHDKTPYSCRSSLAKSVNAINRLILNGWCPPCKTKSSVTSIPRYKLSNMS